MDAVDDRKGVEPVALDVSTLTDITDTMIIVGGTSNRHVKAIVDNVLEMARHQDVEVLGTEGRDQNDWVLIDLVDVVVHVMRAESRAFYDLERLWEEPAASMEDATASPSPRDFAARNLPAGSVAERRTGPALGRSDRGCSEPRTNAGARVKRGPTPH